MSESIRPSPEEDGWDGFKEDFQVGFKASAFDVLKIEFHLFVEGDVTPAADGPDAGEAGGDIEAPSVGKGVEVHLPG